MFNGEKKMKNYEVRYKELKNQIKQKIRIAKEEWIMSQYREIHILKKKYANFNMHKKIKEAAGSLQ